MSSKILQTPIDDLVELIRNKKEVSINYLSEMLKLPVEIVERWLVILEEYNVLDVRYKGFEGFVTLSKKEMDKDKVSNEGKVNVDNLKTIFIKKSKEKNLSYEKMRQVWPIFISEYERDIKQLFEDKAKNSGFEPERIQKAWVRYRKELGVL